MMDSHIHGTRTSRHEPRDVELEDQILLVRTCS